MQLALTDESLRGALVEVRFLLTVRFVRVQNPLFLAGWDLQRCAVSAGDTWY